MEICIFLACSSIDEFRISLMSIYIYILFLYPVDIIHSIFIVNILKFIEKKATDCFIFQLNLIRKVCFYYLRCTYTKYLKRPIRFVQFMKKVSEELFRLIADKSSQSIFYSAMEIGMSKVGRWKQWVHKVPNWIANNHGSMSHSKV